MRVCHLVSDSPVCVYVVAVTAVATEFGVVASVFVATAVCVSDF